MFIDLFSNIEKQLIANIVGSFTKNIETLGIVTKSLELVYKVNHKPDKFVNIFVFSGFNDFFIDFIKITWL